MDRAATQAPAGSNTGAATATRPFLQFGDRGGVAVAADARRARLASAPGLVIVCGV